MVNVENGLNNTVNETHFYLIERFYSQLLGHNNQPVNGDKRGENANPRAPLNRAVRILVSDEFIPMPIKRQILHFLSRHISYLD